MNLSKELYTLVNKKGPNNLKIEKYYPMKLPLSTEHNHVLNEHTRYIGRTHPELLKKLEELILDGELSTVNLKKVITQFSKHVLCPKLDITFEEKNPYINPKRKIVHNTLYNVAKKHGIKLPVVPRNPNARKRIRIKKIQEFLL